MKKEKILKSIYSGSLTIGNIILDCDVLDNETRIISSQSIFKVFDRPSRGSRKIDKFIIDKKVIKLPPFLSSKKLFPLINTVLLDMIKPITFLDKNKEKKGYNAKILTEMCKLYLESRRKGILLKSQEKIAIQSEILLSSFSDIGIIALIDEATGYQYDRKYNTLRVLLEQYIQEEARKWLREFPNEFFTQLDKLYGNHKTIPKNRPMYYGRFINEYIYKPLEEGKILIELQNINPIIKNKENKTYRKNRHHSHMTEKIGLNQLRAQIFITLGLMRASTNIKKFKELFNRSNSNQLTLFDD